MAVIVPRPVGGLIYRGLVPDPPLEALERDTPAPLAVGREPDKIYCPTLYLRSAHKTSRWQSQCRLLLMNKVLSYWFQLSCASVEHRPAQFAFITMLVVGISNWKINALGLTRGLKLRRWKPANFLSRTYDSQSILTIWPRRLWYRRYLGNLSTYRLLSVVNIRHKLFPYSWWCRHSSSIPICVLPDLKVSCQLRFAML